MLPWLTDGVRRLMFLALSLGVTCCTTLVIEWLLGDWQRDGGNVEGTVPSTCATNLLNGPCNPLSRRSIADDD